MKHIICYTGIPHADFDFIQRRARTITGSDTEFYGRGLKNNQHQYLAKDAKAIMQFFADRIRKDKAKQSEYSYSVIYVENETINSTILRDGLFPNFFATGAAWTFQYGSVTEREQNRQDLVTALVESTKKVKRALPHLRKEFTERSNKTPLLLPLQNFEANEISNLLSNVSNGILDAIDPTATIRELVADFERRFPPTLDWTRKPPQTVFTNNASIRFRAPGNDRHGSAHPETEGHPDDCVIAAFKRLGVTYDPHFHYDCTRLSQSKLSAELHNCHLPRDWITAKKSHLNIAPNDAVR